MSQPAETDVAIWRYGLISPLLHRNDEGETLEEAIERLASREFRKPDGKFVRYSPETLRKWLYRYRKGGLPALNAIPRKNMGTHTAVPQPLANRLFALRQEHPRWTFSRVLEQLVVMRS